MLLLAGLCVTVSFLALALLLFKAWEARSCGP